MTTNGKIVFYKKNQSFINMKARFYIQEVSSGIAYEYKIPILFGLEVLESNPCIYSIKITSSGITEYSLGYYDKQSNSIKLNGSIKINVFFGPTSSQRVLDDTANIKGEIFFTKDNNIAVNFNGNFKIKEGSVEIKYTVTSKDLYEKECFY